MFVVGTSAIYTSAIDALLIFASRADWLFTDCTICRRAGTICCSTGTTARNGGQDPDPAATSVTCWPLPLKL